MADARKHTPSFERNIGPITAQLGEIFPKSAGVVLEIGSGSGQHAVHLAESFPETVFQPTEYLRDNLPSIETWRQHVGLQNVMEAKHLDVTSTDWGLPKHHYSALTAFNVIHYAPWAVTEALFANAGQYLKQKGQIIFYGPYKRDGQHTSPSNAEFEEWLKSVDPEFGVRSIEDVEQVAQHNGFSLSAFHPMPANNFMPVFVND